MTSACTRPAPNDPDRLWGSSFSEQEIESCRASDGLLSMELELSKKCNLGCIYCYAGAGEALENELSFEELTNAVNQAAALGARRIVVLGGGEPMCHPRVMDVMRHVHSLGLGIDLFTNGTMMPPRVAREIFALGAHPVIKMNSLREDVQDRLADRPGTYRAIRKGLAALREAGYPAPGLPLGVQSVICGANLDELPEMWIWIRENRMIPYFETITLQGRAKEHPDLIVSTGDARALFEELSRIDRERFGIRWEPHPPVAGLTCNRHAYTCTVTVHGDVLPCPGVDIPVGNIRTTPLAEILKQSPVIRDLRNIRETIKGACRECDQHEECYGCRGHAYQVTGDYLAADPLCWKNRESGS